MGVLTANQEERKRQQCELGYGFFKEEHLNMMFTTRFPISPKISLAAQVHKLDKMASEILALQQEGVSFSQAQAIIIAKNTRGSCNGSKKMEEDKEGRGRKRCWSDDSSISSSSGSPVATRVRTQDTSTSSSMEHGRPLVIRLRKNQA